MCPQNLSFLSCSPPRISSVSLLLLLSFGVVWIAPALCLKSWVQCLQVEFESSPSPQFWSDGVCVFIQSLLLLNVQSVAFCLGERVGASAIVINVQIWVRIFKDASWGGVHDDGMYVWCRFYLLNVSIRGCIHTAEQSDLNLIVCP